MSDSTVQHETWQQTSTDINSRRRPCSPRRVVHGDNGGLIGQRGSVATTGIEHRVQEELGRGTALSNAQQAAIEATGQQAGAVGQANAVSHLPGSTGHDAMVPWCHGFQR